MSAPVPGPRPAPVAAQESATGTASSEQVDAIERAVAEFEGVDAGDPTATREEGEALWSTLTRALDEDSRRDAAGAGTTR